MKNSFSRFGNDCSARVGLEFLEGRLAPALSTPVIQDLGFLPETNYELKGITFKSPQPDFTTWDLYLNGTKVLANQLPDPSTPNMGKAVFVNPLDSFSLFANYVVETKTTTDSAQSLPRIGVNALNQPTIILPNIDWSGPPTGIAPQRVAPDSEVSSILLGANQKYSIPIQNWVGLAPVLASNPEFIVKTNRPGVVDVAFVGQNNLAIDTSILQGKSGITSIQITDPNNAGTITRYLGIQVKDVRGNPPTNPTYVGLGTVNDNTDPSFFQKNVINSTSAAYQQYDYQYVYLNNGPNLAPKWQGSQPSPNDPLVDNTAFGWRTSSGGPDGKKLLQLLNSASQLGSIPTVVYYNIMCGFTNTGLEAGESPEIGLANLKNEAFMGAYFQDLKFTIDNIRKFANGGTVSLIMEPDFLAYMMKSTYHQAAGTWSDPSTIKLNYDVGALAAQVGLLPQGSSTGSDSTLVDWVKAINSGIRHLSQTSVQGALPPITIKLGWKFNLWAADFSLPDGTGWQQGICKVTDWFLDQPNVPFQGKTGWEGGVLFVQDIAAKTANWYKRAGILNVLSSGQLNGGTVQGGGMNFMAIDKYGIDGGNNQAALTKPGYTDPAKTAWYFNADNWSNYVTYASQIRAVLADDLPIWLWQLPVGHINNSTSTNPKTGDPYVPLANNYYTNFGGGPQFGEWEDSAVNYFLGDTFTGTTAGLTDAENLARQNFLASNHANDRSITSEVDSNGATIITWGSHIRQLKDAGVQAILFGPGLPQATMGGGYAGQSPHDDYFWSIKSQQYLAQQKLPLPSHSPQRVLVNKSVPSKGNTGTSVNLFDQITGEPTGTTVPFAGFAGPVEVALGDFTNDGINELVAAAGLGGGPAIAIMDSTSGAVLRSFFAYDSSFTGGVNLAVQDVNNDGVVDIITGAGLGGGPHVKVFNGINMQEFASFFAYAIEFSGGVSVGTADINGDNILDIVTGAGPGGGPHVKVFDGATLTVIREWFAYESTFTGGVFVAMGDLANDGNFEVITGPRSIGGPVVAVFNALTGVEQTRFFAYAQEFRGGVLVGVSSGTGDVPAGLFAVANPDNTPHVKVFSYPQLDEVFSKTLDSTALSLS